MKLERLEKDHFYHIYNRGINGNPIFLTDENKRYFLELAGKYLNGNVSIISFCLLNNHYHFLVKIIDSPDIVTQAFSNLFNAYVKAFNKQNNRTGSLFEKHFKRKKIDSESYLKTLFCYIHRNPSKNWEGFRYSSYHYYVNSNSTNYFELNKTYVLSLFDDLENLKISHYNFKNGDLQGFENLADQMQNKKDNLEDYNDSDLNTTSMKDKFFKYIQDLQNTITSKLESIDGKATFQEDIWKRPEGGGGRTRVIENGKVFEKGGVNISGVHGKLPESMQNYFGVKDADFFACGLSLVLHPKNPMVPTVHANWRYFEMYNSQGEIVDSWFGGGQDLTPYYLFEDDAKHFHKVCKIACDKHSAEFYSTYKTKCDTYFYNAHRNEARGIGGLFFDYCKKTEAMSMENWYDFVTEVGNSFLESYVPIVEKRKALSYTEAQRNWQEIRRGRYVEFNLVHDKGTLFGLKTNGRIESILMSLPPHVQWVYNHHPEEGSEEEKLIKILQNPIDWV
ncbi:oxygen-dependent coproporphyrinogen oxidase [Winogradskyella sp. E313]|uniref:coproporphyrinogen oxidase n=2 Tax=Winogradskyella immobilis TaxID=2816852 RepID=A0ABS8EPP0_9FLAO|nr:oxygen-dependent coproporphyrinogen oxidase [Winogradskyella immobilis]